jgi:hypothetical protein
MVVVKEYAGILGADTVKTAYVSPHVRAARTACLALPEEVQIIFTTHLKEIPTKDFDKRGNSVAPKQSNECSFRTRREFEEQGSATR